MGHKESNQTNNILMNACWKKVYNIEMPILYFKGSQVEISKIHVHVCCISGNNCFLPLQTVQAMMKCHMCVFTVCQSICLLLSIMKRVNVSSTPRTSQAAIQILGSHGHTWAYHILIIF